MARKMSAPLTVACDGADVDGVAAQAFRAPTGVWWFQVPRIGDVRLIAAVASEDSPVEAPAAVRSVSRVPLLRRIIGYGGATGPLPDHPPAFAQR
ncbi:MAG: hypothetical protein ACSLE7_01905 [Mycobacterium sp.]